jgi:hypothetical protein
VNQAGECVLLGQGIDNGDDPAIRGAGVSRCDGLDGHAAAGEDGDRIAAWRAVREPSM